MKILFILPLIISIYSQLTIPFYIEELPKETTHDNFIQNLMNTGLYIKIKIGSNSQELPLLINLISYFTYVINSTEEYNGPKYNIEGSTSYKFISKLSVFGEDNLLSCHKSKEDFNFNGVKINNLTFYLSSKFHVKKNIRLGGQIGLGLITTSSQNLKDTLIQQFYNLEIIKEFPFSFVSKNENEGNLIIGNYLYEIKNPYYNNEDFSIINLEKIDGDIFWTGNGNIFSGNKELSISEGFIITSEYGVNFANSEYYESIEPYLKNKIENKLCEKKYISVEGIYPDYFNDENYYYFVCNDNVDLKDFPSLIIKFDKFEFDVEFNYKDLWIDFKGKKYLNILISDKMESIYSLYFMFGRMFLKKYDMSFDSDRKIMGIYNKKKKKNNNDGKLLIIIAFLVLIVIFVFLIRYIVKSYKYRIAKKTAHELTEDGFYSID